MPPVMKSTRAFPGAYSICTVVPWARAARMRSCMGGTGILSRTRWNWLVRGMTGWEHDTVTESFRGLGPYPPARGMTVTDPRLGCDRVARPHTWNSSESRDKRLCREGSPSQVRSCWTSSRGSEDPYNSISAATSCHSPCSLSRSATLEPWGPVCPVRSPSLKKSACDAAARSMRWCRARGATPGIPECFSTAAANARRLATASCTASVPSFVSLGGLPGGAKRLSRKWVRDSAISEA
mmetsp:Transcript_22482/g.65359  ORF Transcript_22482/g.65359 Transcript_22482/m.65359 type:complete len:238 (-) Transcript_22482:1367-2080(-)